MRSYFEKFEIYTRYSGVADKELKKKVLSVVYGSLQTYTRYSWVADKEQKKVLGVIYGSL